MFLYYLPDVAKLDSLAITRFRLDRLLGNSDPVDPSRIGGQPCQKRPPRPDEPAGSPVVGSGYIAGIWRDGCGEIQLDPARQTWVWVPADGERPEYAVGYWTSQPPRPETLLRDDPIDGEQVTLGDGQAWQIPTARLPPYQTRLPLVLKWEGGPERGQVVTQIVPAWKWLWDVAGEVWNRWFAGQVGSTSVDYLLAVRALSANYRVGPVECSALGLLTTPAIEGIFRALIGASLFEEFFATPEGIEALRTAGLIQPKPGAAGEPDPAEKSTAPPDSNTSPGPPADSPNTVPPAPNSL